MSEDVTSSVEVWLWDGQKYEKYELVTSESNVTPADLLYIVWQRVNSDYPARSSVAVS